MVCWLQRRVEGMEIIDCERRLTRDCALVYALDCAPKAG